MKAYKCDICGKYFEESKQMTGSKYGVYKEDTGHHRWYIRLKPKTDDNEWEIFTGDICPDCMGCFCVGLVERGCQSENVKMYAEDYIKKVRDEKEVSESATTE